MSSSNGEPEILFSTTRANVVSSLSNTPVPPSSTDVQFRVVLAKLAPELCALFVFKLPDADLGAGNSELMVSILIGEDTWTAHAEQTSVVTVGGCDISDGPQISLHLRFDDREEFWTFLCLLIAAKEATYKRHMEICDLVQRAISLVRQSEGPTASG